MRKMYCPQCGGEILFVRERNDEVYSIDEDYNLTRVDNLMRDDAIYFACENDREHNLDVMPDSQISAQDFEAWKDKVTDVYFTM